MNCFRAHVVIREDNKTKLDCKCILKEFLLNLLIFHIEKDIHILIPLNEFELTFENTHLKMTNKNEIIEIYFELVHFKSSLCISDLRDVITFMQKSIYRRNFFKHKFYEIRACKLTKCFRVEDEDMHIAISDYLTKCFRVEDEDIQTVNSDSQKQEKGCVDYSDKLHYDSYNPKSNSKTFPLNPFLTLFLSSIMRFSNFMHFVIKTNKLHLIEKMIALEDHEIMIYLLEYHREIYNLFGYKDHNQASFYFVLSLFQDETFEDYLIKNDPSSYTVLSGEYSKCIKDLQNESICPSSKRVCCESVCPSSKGVCYESVYPSSKGVCYESVYPSSKGVCYKSILNADSPHYPIIFNYVSEILEHNFYFLDTKLFFKQYKDLLSSNPSHLIYLNEGITRIINNCQFEMIFNEEPAKLTCSNRSTFDNHYFIDDEADKFTCSNRSTFYSETDFIHSFFNELQLFLEGLFCLEDISIIHLMEGLTKRETGFIMREIYLNTSFLNLIPSKWISPRMSLAVIKLCEVITNLNSPKLTKESKKILKVYSKWVDNSGPQYFLEKINT